MLPDVQFTLRPGIIELKWGDPDMELLPAAALARATAVALERDGPSALNYGAEQGPGRLIEQLCAWLERREGVASPAEQVFITGGISYALDLLCTLLARPGDVALVESPSYHLAMRIFRDHGLELVAVPADECGMQVGALPHIVEALRQQGRQPRFLYTVPSFGNPTGVSLIPKRRATLAAFARSTGLLVLEDDVYRELWYDGPAPPPLRSLAPDGPIVRLGSFSKILAPGLRLGWLLASPEIVRQCAGSGLVDSGGGASHFTAHAVAAFMELGLLDEHVEVLRVAYRQRRDVLLDALKRFLPRDCAWVRPGGGFFVWVRLPEGSDSTALLHVAETAGVSYAPGSRFCVGEGGECYLRLAFSLLSLAELEEGARRLGTVLHGHSTAEGGDTLEGYST
jgi:2-aminoadipate transaminase